MRCILDSGSQVETITEEAAKRLQLPERRSDVQLIGIGGTTTTSKKIITRIASIHANVFIDIEMVIVPKIVGDQPNTTISEREIDIPEELPLADPEFFRTQPVDILLGARVFYTMLGPNQLTVGRGLTFQESGLGWLAVGILSAPCAATATSYPITEKHESPDLITNEELKELFKLFWKIEEPIWEPKEDAQPDAEAHFCKTIKTANDGRYVTRIPLRGEVSCLGDSYQQARKRFLSLERRLEKSSDTYKEYRCFMHEYEELGHMVPVTAEEFCKIKYFIPHSCVVKPDSTSTKLRVVFDASAKTLSGISLNDIQVVGPTIQRELFDLLIDFKTHDKVLMADIAKMYRQILIAQPDTWLQCILWRKHSNEPLRAYRLLTVTYGEASSSFLACRALYEAAEDYRTINSKITEAIQQSFYVDNLMIGAASTEELIELKHGVEDALLRHCFPLRKWASNDTKVLEGIPERDLEPLIHVGDQDIIKTLGVGWNPMRDVFQFIAPSNEGEENAYEETDGLKDTEIIRSDWIDPASDHHGKNNYATVVDAQFKLG
ncbi:uncharacterized protein LOC129766597 [Toxorhynchites rutilus septentrionalis]|uniref:uncharacterized protein LOC129766597 n=1 Tax=Toxorhynchites rutilus septentrionalis TaxID=329112 RepID=UPI00247AD933|nr:uncharacterized protein LOC129766597 [Toxorhynchites rutilus septentrionalis]